MPNVFGIADISANMNSTKLLIESLSQMYVFMGILQSFLCVILWLLIDYLSNYCDRLKVKMFQPLDIIWLIH